MINVSSLQLPVGGVPVIRDIICVFLRHESEARSLFAHCNKHKNSLVHVIFDTFVPAT